MTRRAPSLWEYLEKNLAETENTAQRAFLRERLDKSELLMSMEQVADEINQRAKALVVEVQSYLPPEALVRSFSFRRRDRDDVLQLENWGSEPMLVFLSRRWRRRPLSDNFFGWLYRTCGIDEFVIEIKFSTLFRYEDVTPSDIERWFLFLVSGFDQSFAPTIPGAQRIASARTLRDSLIQHHNLTGQVLSGDAEGKR